MNLRLPAVVGALLLSPLVAQEKPPSTGPDVALPISDQARLVDERSRIVVDVFRNGDTWVVGLGGKTYTLAGEELAASFRADLGKAVASSAATPTALLVRADANVPYRIPYLAVKAAVEAGLTRILFAARKDAAATAETAILWQLPGDDEPPDPDGLPDIRLTARLKRGKVLRTFEIDPKPIPAGVDGDQKLEGMLRAKRDEQRKLWKVELPVVVEGEASVSWQSVVDLVSLSRRAGSTRIELDMAEPQEDPRAARQRQRQALDVEPAPGDLTSRPTAAITLPRSTHAVAFEEKNPIEVWIFAADAPTATRPVADDWRWQVRYRIYRFDQAGWRGLTVNLAQRSSVVGQGSSSRSLLIRADARAQYGVIQKTLEAAALARIYKIHIAAVRDSGVPVEAVSCWLPRDRQEAERSDAVSEIRLIMSWNPGVSRLERLLGQSACPQTPEGDAKLESMARASFAALSKDGRRVSLIIDAGPRVPCQAIVDALDLARKVGIELVEFGFGTTMK